ncbi:MAG: right-handed parallel beta-helix repeat-containing protein, partial [Planctomycetota bacterium]
MPEPDDDPPLKHDGYEQPLDKTGKEFTFSTDHPYFPNLKITSTSDVRIVLMAVKDMISFHIEAARSDKNTISNSTHLTISGLPAKQIFFLYQDGYLQRKITTDPKTGFSYTQKLDKPHLINIQTYQSTLSIGTGLPSPFYTYDAPTNTYTLIQDVNEPVVITADGVTLDGNNFAVIGPDSGTGIMVANYNNVTVKNCRVSRFSYGIFVYNNSQINLDRNVCTNNFTGIWSEFSSDATVQNNECNDNLLDPLQQGPDDSGFGILAIQAARHTVKNNKTARNHLGIILSFSSQSTLQANESNNNNRHGLALEASSDNTARDNVCNSNARHGINVIENSNNNLVFNNACQSNSRHGLRFRDSSGNMAYDNTLTQNQYSGLMLQAPNQNTLIYHNNIFSNVQSNASSDYGILLSYYNPATLRYEGNYWGKTVAPGFYLYGGTNTPFDSNGSDVYDSYPYLVRDGWNTGVAPTPLPPASGKIVFDSDRDGNREIYLMNADGTNQTRLTNHPSDDRRAVLSPDGTKVIWMTDRDGNSEIYVMNNDGSNPVNLTKDPGNDRRPDFSPDGARIVFHSNRGGSFQLYVMNADGSNQVQLTNISGQAREAVFSPDGTKIAFDSIPAGQTEPDIYIMNSDGTNQVNLTNHPAEDAGAAFSFDGTKIYWESLRDGNAEIYVMNLNGTNPLNLTNNPTDEAHAVVSLDGRFVYFSSDRSGNYEIYQMNTDGSNQINLTLNPAQDNAGKAKDE